jgi:hypothetical protein
VPLSSFDVVYRAYVHIVEKNSQLRSPPPYADFPHQPYRLLEAYALAWQAANDKSLTYTSHWGRQQGATTAAIAMAMTSPDVTLLVSDMKRAKEVTSRIFRAFKKESGNIHSHLQPNVVHKNVWWMTGVRHCVHGRQPSLVIVDSETAWRKERDQAIGDLRHFLQCGVVVFDAKADFLL